MIALIGGRFPYFALFKLFTSTFISAIISAIIGWCAQIGAYMGDWQACVGVNPHRHSAAFRGEWAWVVVHGFHPWLSSLREHPAIRRGYNQRAIRRGQLYAPSGAYF